MHAYHSGKNVLLCTEIEWKPCNNCLNYKKIGKIYSISKFKVEKGTKIV